MANRNDPAKTNVTTELTWRHFPTGPNGFFRAPVLLSGNNEAILIDGGFTLPDGKKLADAIKTTGKTLTTIYISQSDPDYYFSLAPIKAAFPSVRVIAASETIQAIKASVDKKIAAWGPQLKEDGPQSLSDIIMPETFDEPELNIEGNAIHIVNAIGLVNRRYLWVPSLNAIFGGILVFSGVHVWTADTQTVESRQAWINTLESMAARKPSVVVPGHLSEADSVDASSITYTRDYLLAFEEERIKAKSSAELITAMSTRYPAASMEVALQIGAKVALGEMKWG